MNAEDTPTQSESNPPSTWQWLMISGIVIVVLCAAAAFIYFAYQTYNLWVGAKNQVNLPGHSPGLLKQLQLFWRFLFFLVILNVIPNYFRCHLVA